MTVQEALEPGTEEPAAKRPRLLDQGKCMLHFFDFDFCGDGGLNLEKKKKQSAVNSKLDADDSDDDDSEDDKDDEEENDDDDDDDEAELLRELEKIKRERAIEQEKKVLSSSSPFPSLPFVPSH